MRRDSRRLLLPEEIHEPYRTLFDSALLRDFVEWLVLFFNVVFVLVVDVYVCALDVGEAFEFSLQGLADVMCDFQG